MAAGPANSLRAVRTKLPVLTTNFRPGVSFATFSYLRNYLWHMVWRWVQRKHPQDGSEEDLPPLLRP
ncbi:group II intron maturase-specific domain-containing protein [Streptomyces mirabilis]|uniref:group II intron maturase-specific domain-containing protein n=1 Tax=Streptomyces mirabilis TaxID=68239 RepID=UPI0033A615C5